MHSTSRSHTDGTKDVCPSCGDFAKLGEYTGFCSNCDTDKKCSVCGNEITYEDQTICAPCRYTRWLVANADAIESYMANGFSYKDAKAQVRKDNKPSCVACGKPLFKARPDSNFCKDNIECRRTNRAYRHKREKGMPKDAALQSALDEHKERTE